MSTVLKNKNYFRKYTYKAELNVLDDNKLNFGGKK